MSIAGSRIELASFDSEFWLSVNPLNIDTEDVVAKMHLLDVLEGMSPYRTRSDYSQRVFHSLSQLQQHPDMTNRRVEAALTLFSNVFFVTQQMYEDAWRSLFRMLITMLHPRSIVQDMNTASAISIAHFFENDPSGMFGKFCHSNGVQGRLDNEKFSKLNDVDKLGRTILDLECDEGHRRQRALMELEKVFGRQYWVVLVDKSLSGHSLSTDLSRLCKLLKLRGNGAEPEIVVLAQIMTDQAMQALRASKELFEFIDRGKLSICRAIRLSNAHRIMTDGRDSLIKNDAIRNEARELCKWFSHEFIRHDPELDRMRQKSGDDLEYGYRGCGLLLTDHQNCPTDSIPLLWHSINSNSFRYEAPYPRVHSRIGDQNQEPVADMWEEIYSSKKIAQALKLLGR